MKSASWLGILSSLILLTLSAIVLSYSLRTFEIGIVSGAIGLNGAVIFEKIREALKRGLGGSLMIIAGVLVIIGLRTINQAFNIDLIILGVFLLVSGTFALIQLHKK